jgi:Leucine-rich repeat (LRR) protein
LDCGETRLRTLPSLPSTLERLTCSYTQIQDLPPLSHTNLAFLLCNETPLQRLPRLPPTLIHLSCYRTRISRLPSLPPRLRDLYCYETDISELPDLPSTLRILQCNTTKITEFPELPIDLCDLICHTNELVIPTYKHRPLHLYIERSNAFYHKKQQQKCQERYRLLKEELVAAVWHPRRVERLIETYGLDVLEGL